MLDECVCDEKSIRMKITCHLIVKNELLIDLLEQKIIITSVWLLYHVIENGTNLNIYLQFLPNYIKHSIQVKLECNSLRLVNWCGLRFNLSIPIVRIMHCKLNVFALIFTYIGERERESI